MARPFGLIVLVMLLVSALPARAQSGSGCPTPMTFSPGQPVFTRPGIFVRNLPTISGGQVGYYPVSRTFKIIGGPVCADGLNWWQVTTPGNPGWVAEATPELVMLFPDTTFNEGHNCQPSLGFAAGSEATLLTDARLRADPTRGGQVLTVLPTGAVLAILGGPTCAEAINWWPVRTIYPGTTSTVDGWVAEAADGMTFLAASSTGQAPTTAEHCPPAYYRLSIGVRAVVTYRGSTAKNLRAQPGLDAAILTRVLRGVEVDIIGGPTCEDGLNWWQLRVVGQPDLVGWLADGGTANWLRPLIYD